MNAASMIFNALTTGTFPDDEDFDRIYPESLREIAAIHFTPIEVARLAVPFLVNQPNTKVLDIGAGAGKFCLLGAALTQGHFTGVEQRAAFVSLANALKEKYKLSKVSFIHANITDIDFSPFDAFYYFNSFYENIDQSGIIDQTVELDKELYKTYTNYVKAQLAQQAVGTKLATYFSYRDEVPATYQIIAEHEEGKLLFWQKVA